MTQLRKSLPGRGLRKIGAGMLGAGAAEIPSVSLNVVGASAKEAKGTRLAHTASSGRKDKTRIAVSPFSWQRCVPLRATLLAATQRLVDDEG
jgi:hypothetical protein